MTVWLSILMFFGVWATLYGMYQFGRQSALREQEREGPSVP